MKHFTTLCVYGDFKKGDIRIKFLTNESQYSFQSTLQSAGYDAELFNIYDTDIPNFEEIIEKFK